MPYFPGVLRLLKSLNQRGELKMTQNITKNRTSALRASRGASLVEYGLLAGLVSIVSIAAVSGLGREVEQSFTTTVSILADRNLDGQEGAVGDLTGTSCQDIYDQGGRQDGIYTINAGGGEMRVGCHFESAGPMAGGWTVVAHQLEASPVGWNDGIDPARPDAGYFDTGFALSNAQLPNHSAFAVGWRAGESMTILEGAQVSYTTGNIALNGILGLISGDMFDIHRSSSAYHFSHDPDMGADSDPSWNNTLTFDRDVGGIQDYTWAFSPNTGALQQRGYSYDGTNYEAVLNSEAWVVYVR